MNGYLKTNMNVGRTCVRWSKYTTDSTRLDQHQRRLSLSGLVLGLVKLTSLKVSNRKNIILIEISTLFMQVLNETIFFHRTKKVQVDRYLYHLKCKVKHLHAQLKTPLGKFIYRWFFLRTCMSLSLIVSNKQAKAQ